jgi:hypothetical protein
VGASSVPVPQAVPQLPEDRMLMALQKEIEEEYGMKLGSDGSGKSGQKRERGSSEVPGC